MLVKAGDEQGEPFTDRELLGQLHILLVAGHETTTTLSAWLFYCLPSASRASWRDPRGDGDGASRDEWRDHAGSAQGDAPLGNAVDEAGRLRSPVGNVPRGVVKDFEFGGYQCPQARVCCSRSAACHRLPMSSPTPDVSTLTASRRPREEDKRTPYSLVTFGGGPRICIGINFAQVEVKAMAAHILPRFDLAPGAGEGMQVYFSPAATILGGVRYVSCAPKHRRSRGAEAEEIAQRCRAAIQAAGDTPHR